jgi:hypothetical protein
MTGAIRRGVEARRRIDQRRVIRSFLIIISGSCPWLCTGIMCGGARWRMRLTFIDRLPRSIDILHKDRIRLSITEDDTFVIAPGNASEVLTGHRLAVSIAIYVNRLTRLVYVRALRRRLVGDSGTAPWRTCQGRTHLHLLPLTDAREARRFSSGSGTGWAIFGV